MPLKMTDEDEDRDEMMFVDAEVARGQAAVSN